MTRTYELGFIVEPRQTDEAVEALTEKVKEMLAAAGATITNVESWGKRKLAYAINKIQEGKYVFIYFSSEGAVPAVPEIQRLMSQDENVLRFLTVRTDLDLKRAASKGKEKPEEVDDGETR